MTRKAVSLIRAVQLLLYLEFRAQSERFKIQLNLYLYPSTQRSLQQLNNCSISKALWWDHDQLLWITPINVFAAVNPQVLITPSETSSSHENPPLNPHHAVVMVGFPYHIAINSHPLWWCIIHLKEALIVRRCHKEIRGRRQNAKYPPMLLSI